jgi:hypothetical protein
VAEGEDALGNNQTLTAAVKAELAGKTLQQVWLEIKATGRSTFSFGKSRFRGIYFKQGNQKWQARLWVASTRQSLGFWRTEEQAARAYDAAARRIHGR